MFLYINNSSFDIDSHKISEFKACTKDTVFLFDDKISEYIEKILIKALKLDHSMKYKVSIKGCKSNKSLRKEEELLEWFIQQEKYLQKTFSPYLKFEVWKKPKGVS